MGTIPNLEVILLAEVSKCPECGAEIEGGGKFCPNCGTELTAEARPPRETQPTRGTGYGRPDLVETIFSKKVTLAGTILGILLAWIGGLIRIFVDVGTAGMSAARVLNGLGLMIIGVFIVGSGVSNSKLNQFVRLGMILGGILLIALTLAI